ncbi:MAG: carboxylating nicotinate-nucleotide diphosphorylase [Candidatus Omnitrophica bacterium]|nr:carboxylating nicotinate-nucleotide diphosphorylase [Candidatus Omnitrophota bacterium]
MNYVNDQEIINIIKQALKEDIGRADITTRVAIAGNIKAEAVIIAKEKGIICGMDIVRLVFKMFDQRINFKPLVKDGDIVNKGKALAKLYGFASSILSSERVALNFLGFLSGIATRTEEFARRARPYKIKILDTRKTLPLLRKLEKYAVKVGGGVNHRLRLDEMVLIKENHLEVAGLRDIREMIKKLRKKIRKNIKIEVEVRNLKEFKEVLSANPDIIMLDNMKTADIKKAVRLRNNLQPKTYNLTPRLEASGNISLKNISVYARTGVDFISLGTLTKDIESLDVSLEFK